MYTNIYNIFISHKVFFISYIAFRSTYSFMPFLLLLSLLPKSVRWEAIGWNHLNFSFPSPRRTCLHLIFPCPLGSGLPFAHRPADCSHCYPHVAGFIRYLSAWISLDLWNASYWCHPLQWNPLLLATMATTRFSYRSVLSFWVSYPLVCP